MIPFKKTILAAALIAAAPLAAAADAQTGGFDMFVSGGLGYSSYDLGSGAPDVDDTNAELRASFAYTDKSGIGFQLDNVYTRQYMGDFFDYYSTYDIAGHVYYRTPNWLVGGFYQNRSFSYETGDPSSDVSLDASMDDQQFYGVEAQGFFGNLTVGGVLGEHKMGFAGGALDGTGTLAGIEARYFMNDNWRIDAGYLYDNVDLNGVDLETQRFNLGTEYRFAGSPMSLFAQYSRINTEIDTYDMDEDRILAGVKFNFGKDSLRKRDRDGASLNPVQPVGFSGFPLLP